MQYDARQIANCLLDTGDRRGIELTHLAIQKLVYFSHGLAYARFGEGLVLNRFEAWKNGPVIRELYFAFNQFEENPITDRATLLNFDSGLDEVIRYDFSPQLLSHLDEICRIYGPLPAGKLIAMTHERGTPWEHTISRATRSANVGMLIDEDLIRRFFTHAEART